MKCLLLDSNRRSGLLLLIVLVLVGTSAAFAQTPRKGKPPKEPPAPAVPAIALGAELNFGRVDLMVMDADGSNQTILIEGAKEIAHRDPTWSPDGEWIVFGGGANLPDGSGIYVVRTDGSDLTLVHAVEAGLFSWSLDGNWILFSAPETPGDIDGDLHVIEVIDVDSGLFAAPHRLTRSAGYERTPSWAPSSDRIVTNSMDANLETSLLVVYDLEFSDVLECLDPVASLPCISAETVLDNPAIPSFSWNVSWSKVHPTWIATSAEDPEFPGFRIWFVDVTGQCPPVDLTGPDERYFDVDWSSDDTKLLFSIAGGQGLYTLDVIADGNGCVIGGQNLTLIAEPRRKIFKLIWPQWKRSSQETFRSR